MMVLFYIKLLSGNKVIYNVTLWKKRLVLDYIILFKKKLLLSWVIQITTGELDIDRTLLKTDIISE